MRKILITLLCFSSIIFSQTWQHFNISNSPLPDNEINSIIFGTDGTTWVATSSGLASYKNGTWHTFKTSEGLSSNLVNALLMKTDEKDLWLGTDYGSTNFTVTDNQITSEPEYFNKSNSTILSNDIRALGIDHGSHVWLGTNSGISVLLASGVRNITVGDATVGAGLKSNEISGFAVDSDGQINVATAGGGVSRFNIDEVDGISSASIIEETWSALLSDSVFAIYVDSDNVRWIGTERGIFTHIGEDSKDINNWIAYYHTGNGLVSNRITSITEDISGNMWVGTEEGISYFNGTEWNSITSEDGLPGNNVKVIAADSENNIWIGTDNGLSVLLDFSVDIEDFPLPQDYEMKLSVYPNPFNPTTNISFTTPENGNVELTIYDLSGRRISTLLNDFKTRGEHQLKWNGLNNSGEQLSSGIYFLMLKSKSSVLTQKLIYLK